MQLSTSIIGQLAKQINSPQIFVSHLGTIVSIVSDKLYESVQYLIIDFCRVKFLETTNKSFSLYTLMIMSRNVLIET